MNERFAIQLAEELARLGGGKEAVAECERLIREVGRVVKELAGCELRYNGIRIRWDEPWIKVAWPGQYDSHLGWLLEEGLLTPDQLASLLLEIVGGIASRVEAVKALNEALADALNDERVRAELALKKLK